MLVYLNFWFQSTNKFLCSFFFNWFRCSTALLPERREKKTNRQRGVGPFISSVDTWYEAFWRWQLLFAIGISSPYNAAHTLLFTMYNHANPWQPYRYRIDWHHSWKPTQLDQNHNSEKIKRFKNERSHWMVSQWSIRTKDRIPLYSLSFGAMAGRFLPSFLRSN